jgi:hypothetical protein
MTGQVPVKMPKTEICGPGGQVNGGKTYDTKSGAKGMRETYKETGTPGKGSK